MANTPERPNGKLYFSQLGGEQPIPPKFLAAMERREEKQPVRNDVKPEPLSDEIVESAITTDRLNERVRRTVKKKPGNIVLRDIRTNDQGQPVQVVLTLFRKSDKTFEKDVPTVTRTTATEDLGNGWSIQETLIEGRYDEAGKFVEGIFTGNVFEKSRDKVIPPRFTASIPVETTRVDEAGTAQIPELTGDELRERQEQITQFKKRTEISSQPDPAIPVILSKGKDTNDRKQSVSIVETLMESDASVETPTILKDVKVTQISEDLKIQEVRTILELFGAKLFVEEVPDNLPKDFRALLATTTTEEIVEGTAALPVLGANQLLSSEQQITELTKLVKLVTREGISLPVTLLSKETNQDKQDVIVTRTLRVEGSDTLATALIDVVVENLGDGNVVETTRTKPSTLDKVIYENTVPDVVPPRFQTQDKTTTRHVVEGNAGVPSLTPGVFEAREAQVDTFVKEVTQTQRDDSSPAVLGGQEYDPVLDIPLQYTETVEPAGTSLGTNRKTVRPLNEDLDEVRTQNVSAIQAVLDAYIKSFAGDTNIDFPAVLTELTGYEEGGFAGGTFGPLGATYTLSGNGSGAITLNANVHATAHTMLDLGFKVTQPWGSNKPCMHYLFFVASGTTRAGILTKLNSIASISAADWPKFVPEALNFVCQGQKATAEKQLSAHASDSIHTDFNGDIKHSGLIRTTHAGTSLDLAGTLKIVRIPPTIHGALNVGGTTTNTRTTVAQGLIDVGVASTFLQSTGAVSAGSAISPTTVAPTAGQPTITAALGLRLYRINSELAQYDRIRVHCEVVDFANIV